MRKKPRYNYYGNCDDHSGQHGSQNKLYVGNISSDARERDLEVAFGRYGRVQRVYLHPENFGFVVFYDPQDADAARCHLNGQAFFGSRICVEFARDHKIPRYDNHCCHDDQYNRYGQQGRNTKLFVSNISRDIQEYHIEGLFSIYGRNFMIPRMQIMQDSNLMAKNLVGAASLLSLQQGPSVVQEVLLLSTAMTVGHMGMSPVIAKLVTGKIGATGLEKRAVAAKTAGTAIMISAEGEATQGPCLLVTGGADAGVTQGAAVGVTGGTAVLLVKNFHQEASIAVTVLRDPHQGIKLNVVIHIRVTTGGLAPMAKAMIGHQPLARGKCIAMY